jgi:putative transposase
MARIARVIAPGHPHHITQRGNRRQQTFFCDDDYRRYLQLMSKSCRRHRVRVLTYCLMPNHVHLIAVPPSAEGLRLAVGEAHRRYSRGVNQRQGWRGHLWQGRFASYILEETHLLTALRYVARNPVEAGLCRRAWDYRWSSARAHVKGESDALVKAGALRDLVGNWRRFLAEGVTDKEAGRLRHHERTGRPLGSETFVARLEKKLGTSLQMKKRGPRGPWKHKPKI